MANDEESIYRAARAACARVADSLRPAHKNMSAALKSFDGMVGISWNSLGDKLAKRKACAAHYNDLKSALAAADAAIAKAEAACTALTRATQG